MTEEEFLDELQEILQRDEKIKPGQSLDDIEEWDSLARLSFMSMVDAEFNISLENGSLESAKTVDDLIQFVRKELD